MAGPNADRLRATTLPCKKVQPGYTSERKLKGASTFTEAARRLVPGNVITRLGGMGTRTKALGVGTCAAPRAPVGTCAAPRGAGVLYSGQRWQRFGLVSENYYPGGAFAELRPRIIGARGDEWNRNVGNPAEIR